jgi:DegV family protein with EDD domain
VLDMPGVTVITDSSTCLPPHLADALHIVVLPISVNLPESDGSVVEAPDGSTWEVPPDIENDELMGATHPFVTEYLSAIETAGYEAAVVITPAVEFATMYRNAALAAELSSRPTVILDARTAAAGQALVVLAGAQAAAAGADLDEVVRAAEDASRRVELVASLASIEPIRRSGPVPEEVLSGGEMNGDRSLFRMRDGTVEPLGSTSSAEASLEMIRDAFVASTGAGTGAAACTVFHAGAPVLARQLEQLLGNVDFVSGFSIAMQVHTGRGVVGAAWLPGRHDYPAGGE